MDAVLHVRRAFAAPESRSAFVSFSVKRSSGVSLGDEPAQPERARARASMPRAARRRARDAGARAPRSQDQVLRNQSVGSRWSVRRFRPAVGRRDADQDVVGGRLRVLDEDVEVAVVVEDAGVEQLELRVARGRGGGSPRRAPRTGTRAAGTCRGTSCRSASASSRGRSSTPSRPRRGCPRAGRGRTAAPSGSGRARSRARARSRGAGGCRRCRRCRPRPSGRRASGRGRAGSSPRRCRAGCSPRARCPTAAR